MRIRITEPSRPTLTHSLGSRGDLEIYVPSSVEADLPGGGRDRVRNAFALRWTGCPREARMSQVLSLRAFLRNHAAMYVPLLPDPPHTTSVRPVGGYYNSIPLSAPEGARTWTLDAVPTRDGRCPAGRGYISDASYSSSDRDRSAMAFYDTPQLSLASVEQAVIRAGLRTEDHRSYELIALFHTELWIGNHRLGAAIWSCSWSHAISAGMSVGGSRRFEPPLQGQSALAVFQERPAEGPTPQETRRMIFRWRDRRGQYCPTLTPSRPR